MSYLSKRTKTREDKTGSLYALVYYTIEDDESGIEHCCSHEAWALYEIETELASLGVPVRKIQDFQLAVRAVVHHECATDEQCY